METSLLTVEGMACEHCVQAVKGAVGGLSGVKSVAVDLKKKTVSVEYDSAKSSLDDIRREITDQGYEVVA
jgi:copper chaperone